MKKTLPLILTGLITVNLCAGKTETAKDKQAALECDERFTRLRKGINIHGEDQEHPHYREIPENLTGKKIAVRHFKSAKPLEFDIEKEGLVTLVVAKTRSGRSLKTLKSEGWAETDQIVISWYDESTMDMVVLQKKLSPGSYSIPCQGELGIRLMEL